METPAQAGVTQVPVTMMRAAVRHTYGTPDVLRVAEVAVPSIGDREVLLRVHAAGLDRGAWHLMTGRPYLMRLVFGLRKPRNPLIGREVAGTVVAVGSAVTTFDVGDAVFGIAPGSFAEYAVARADRLVRKPANISFTEASVAPISGATALRSLTDLGRLQAGQHVLVTGASGGIGSYAVQLAKSFGATVTAVCSPAKADLVRSLGADHVLDYTRDDFADGTQRYDLILDIAGNPTLTRLRRALTPTGTAVLVGGEDGGDLAGGMNRGLRAMALSPFVRQRLVMVPPDERLSHIERLGEILAAGTVTSTVDRTFPLDETPAAMRYLEAGKARGKVAIIAV
jgi:NADPH:quinone reductase-like Zn-dependent oxidoreductase